MGFNGATTVKSWKGAITTAIGDDTSQLQWSHDGEVVEGYLQMDTGGGLRVWASMEPRR